MTVQERPSDPMTLFAQWNEPITDSAVCLSTVTRDHCPNARIVLLRGAGEEGFHFFTSTLSPKAEQFGADPCAAMTWYWPPDRQVRAEGTIVAMTDTASDALWADRPRDAQLQVMAFRQSAVVSSREDLEDALLSVRRQSEHLEQLPRPEHWGGFTLVPDCLQFWERGSDALPDRHLYRREDRSWTMVRLAP